MDVPAEMDALVAESATGVDAVKLVRIPVPRPARGQVLVKVHAAPCNPADLLYVEGRYGIDRPLPATLGFEGSGEVVASGGGALARYQLGRKVAVGGHETTGTWAEYCVARADQCVPLRKGVTLEQGATALANPITTLALLALARRGGHRAYVQTGAAGQLGRMLLVLGLERGLRGVHVVRRADQAEVLRKLGGEHIVVSSEADFPARLAAACRGLGATIAFDAVAGPLTGQLVDALPKESEVIVYGALSGEPCGAIDPMQLAFGHKRVRGFEIAAHLREAGLLASLRLAGAAQKLVATGRITTTIRARIPLRDAPSALPSYVRSMSDGKLLLLP
ncbi:MAG TPA: zinc-binding dehydrogenase [Kofleriaceae bacterium]|nr:zinc-binding dehydrogenase [Kofleriaceae bacterium]